jgi:hypothetical protein
MVHLNLGHVDRGHVKVNLGHVNLGHVDRGHHNLGDVDIKLGDMDINLGHVELGVLIGVLVLRGRQLASCRQGGVCTYSELGGVSKQGCSSIQEASQGRLQEQCARADCLAASV